MTEATDRVKLSDYLLHGIYYFFYGLVKYIPSPVGDFLRYYVTKPFIKKMGNVRISEGVTIGFPYRVIMGNNITLNQGVVIDGYGRVEIHDYCRLAHRVTILSSDHIISNPAIPIYKQGLSTKKTIIEKDCWLGCNSVILPGVTVKTGSVVAANAVVTKEIPSYTVWGGVPAKQISRRDLSK